jgi:hypothetical protein
MWEETQMENWYGTLINQNNRHRELLRVAEEEQRGRQCQADSPPAFRVQRLADLAVLVGIVAVALRGSLPKPRSSQKAETQTAPGATPRSVKA